MTTPKKVLFLAIGPDSTHAKDPDFVKMLREQGDAVETRNIKEARSFVMAFRAFREARDIAKFDLVIAQEYFCSFGLCLRSLLSRRKTKLAVIGFNVSRRYLTTSSEVINKMINYVFGQLSLIVVHSRAERNLFSRKHSLDDRRIAVALWGYDIPRSFEVNRSNQHTAQVVQPYVCMIGRNNRDFETLIQAIHGTPIRAIFVTSAANPVPVPGTGQILVKYDLPFDECLRIIEHAALNVSLLKDAERGAGHITSVSAMMLGKAQVFSGVDVVSDYVIAGQHGISVPLRDALSARSAILELYNDEHVTEKLGAQAKQYALKYLSNFRFQNRLFNLVSAILHDQPYDNIDLGWQNYIDHPPCKTR